MASNPQEFKAVMAQVKILEDKCWEGFKSILEQIVAGEDKGIRIIMMSKDESNFYCNGILYFVRNTQDFEKGYIEIGYIEEQEDEEKQYNPTHKYVINLEGYITLNDKKYDKELDSIGEDFRKILDEIEESVA